MKRYADLAYTILMVWTMAGLFGLILVAGIAGPDSHWTVAAALIFIGPFLVGAIAMLSVFWAHIIRDEWNRARR